MTALPRDSAPPHKENAQMPREYLCEAGDCHTAMTAERAIVVTDKTRSTQARFCCYQHLAEWAERLSQRLREPVVASAYDHDAP